MARGYNNYQYETSPRKVEPYYIPKKHKKAKKKNTNQVRKTAKSASKNKVVNIDKLKKLKVVLFVALIFGVLLVISYRNSQITEQFSELKNMKSNLAALEKENEQLKVNIESNINLSKIEKEAQEQLGMQKLDNGQKIYVSLPKKDYVEPASEDIIKTEKVNWFEKIINSMLGKE